MTVWAAGGGAGDLVPVAVGFLAAVVFAGGLVVWVWRGR